jgi:hypothetical protein
MWVLMISARFTGTDLVRHEHRISIHNAMSVITFCGPMVRGQYRYRANQLAIIYDSSGTLTFARSIASSIAFMKAQTSG